MDQTHYQSNKEILDIKSIIQFGIRKSEFFSISTFKLDGKEVEVKIRGLSNYEYDEINIEMYSQIKDPETIKYVFDISNEETIEKISEQSEQSEIDKELPDLVNPVEILKAYMYKNVLIVFHSMKDYYKDLTIESVKQLEGIDEIAKRINEKSGRTIDIQNKIEFFREK